MDVNHILHLISPKIHVPLSFWIFSSQYVLVVQYIRILKKLSVCFLPTDSIVVFTDNNNSWWLRVRKMRRELLTFSSYDSAHTDNKHFSNEKRKRQEYKITHSPSLCLFVSRCLSRYFVEFVAQLTNRQCSVCEFSSFRFQLLLSAELYELYELYQNVCLWDSEIESSIWPALSMWIITFSNWFVCWGRIKKPKCRLNVGQTTNETFDIHIKYGIAHTHTTREKKKLSSNTFLTVSFLFLIHYI